MTNLSCINCDSKGSQPLFSGPSFDQPKAFYKLSKCTDCGLVITEKPTAPMETFYKQDYYGSKNSKFLPFIEFATKWSSDRRIGKLVPLLKKNINTIDFKILDIGCGRANFLKAARRRGMNCVGVEMPGYQFPSEDQGILYLHGPLEHLSLENQSFDAISIWHVLEHVENPTTTIETISRLLKKGGILQLAVPNFGSTQSMVFKQHWFHLDLPRHLYHFNESTLVNLLSRFGLEPVQVQYHSTVQNLYGFIQSFLNFLYPDQSNELYRMLKAGKKERKTPLRIKALHLFIGTLMFPVSVIENLFSVVGRRGASLIVYAKKS